MADDIEYLEPSFDPSSVTVPKLRNILMTHDIRYPASAKKPELIDIFSQQLKPRSRKLLAARDRVRRTSEGITYIPSSQESLLDAEESDRASMPPPPVPDTPRRRKSRKSMRAASDDRKPEADSAEKRLNGKRSTSKQMRQSDTESEADLVPSSSKKKSRPPTEAVPRDEDATPRRPELRESAFSDENPFQRGSSSPIIEATNRRKTTGSSKSRQRSSSDRRKTDGAQIFRPEAEEDASAVVSSRHSVESPVSKIKQTHIKLQPDSALEPGEEFTPDECREVRREQQISGGTDPLSQRKTKVVRRRSSGPKSLPWLALTAILGGYATWFRQEKLAVGYCGIGHPSESFSSLEIPEWADIFRPTCEICPQHAICYENLETKCEDGFLLQLHPLSLGGLAPLAPTCEPDGERARKIKRVADKAVEKLRERNAQAECGTLVDSVGKTVAADISEHELKDTVAKQRRKGMSQSEFEDLWKGAIGEIIGREEVVQSSGSSDGHRLTSTSLAKIPFGCSLRRSARLTLARYRGSISIVTLLSLLALYGRRRILQSRADTARIPALVASTLDRLATQAAVYTRGDALESWISVGQLRDDVLRDEFSDARRGNIWNKVQKVVEKNANVRASSRELRGGDVSRVWEWIGSIGLLDDPGFSGRKSGGKRVSWGGAEERSEKGQRNSSPLNDEAEGKTDGDINDQRRWDEGRPIY